ncbi:acyltransferase family protein [Rhizobacter fulvus]|jgi:peptidoglycan/LPS O-acetylase OafA/YrhL
MSERASPAHHEYGVLDGWRGISIALVLLGHLFPLSPKAWQMNEAVAASGMALFFTLSGFLITTFLLRDQNIAVFLIRRFFRIVPLAWVFSAITLAIVGTDLAHWAAHFLFYANNPPFFLLDPTAHLWSLCVEVQFYLGIALIVGLLGKRGLMLIPVLCLVVTVLRVVDGVHVSIVTWYRVDEILAGGILALGLHSGRRPPSFLVTWPITLVLAALLLASAHPLGGSISYLRPYLAATLVGTTLFNPNTVLGRALLCAPLAYLAKLSYALYVIHGGLTSTWLASGDTLVKYLKRPLMLAVTFGLAHLSTTQLEARCIALGKTLSDRVRVRQRKGIA